MTTTTESAVQILENWAKSHLTNLFEFSSGKDENGDEFDAMVRRTFGEETKVVLNHKSIQLNDFLTEIKSREAGVTSAKVEFKEIMGRLKDEDTESDIVAGSLVVTRFFRIRIRAAAMQMATTIFFSMSVDQAQDRRIKEIFLTEITRPVPVQLLPSGGK